MEPKRRWSAARAILYGGLAVGILDGLYAVVVWASAAHALLVGLPAALFAAGSRNGSLTR